MSQKEMMLEVIRHKIVRMEKALEINNCDRTFLHLPDEIIEIDYHIIKRGLNWLNNIFENEFINWKTIWNMQKSDVWESQFKLKFCDNQRQIIQLKKAGKLLRKELLSNGRPDLFKKGKLKREITDCRRTSQNSSATRKETGRITTRTSTND